MLQTFGDKPLSGGFSDGDPDDLGEGGWSNSLYDSLSNFLIFFIVVVLSLAKVNGSMMLIYSSINSC